MKHQKLKLFTQLLLLTLPFLSHGQEIPITNEDRTFAPSLIYQTDERFSHHVALVEKSTHILYLYENKNGAPELVKKYRIATGKITGDKQNEGDHKTPEGVYLITSFLPEQELLQRYGQAGKIYGAGAFTLNYPNVVDARSGKKGGGIWLHSTDDDSRIDKGLDSKGCVVLSSTDIVDISRYIDIDHTPLVIHHEIPFVKRSTWNKMRLDLQQTVEAWAKAWREEDINNYIRHYHPQEFKDNSRGNYQNFKEYKKAVFSNPGKPHINFTNISFLSFENYVVAQMQQEYQSETIKDTGKKILYLMRNENYEWKIVAEEWEKLRTPNNYAFTPSMRFFKEKAK